MQTPVTTPIVKDNITRNRGETVLKSKTVIIKHINSAKKAVTIISFLSFMILNIKELRY